jgi:molecular chaperone Hsp33
MAPPADPILTGMAVDNLIQPFQIEHQPVYGRVVWLGPVVETVLARHDYPEPVAVMLAEMLVLAAGLAASLKYDGVFTLQTKSDGPISMIVVDMTSAGEIRGYAQFDAERLQTALATPGPGRPAGGPLGDSVPRLLGAGHLALTVDQGEHTERYQGVVELVGATLADCMQAYYRQSEQVQAGIRVAVGRVADADGASLWRAGAIILHRLPPTDHAAEEPEEEGWRRALALISSSTDDELLDPGLGPHGLLRRLFDEDRVRVYRARPIEVGCRCSRERVTQMLRAMPRAEIETLKVDDALVVTCGFCNAGYRFDDAQLRALFEEGQPSVH